MTTTTEETNTEAQETTATTEAAEAPEQPQETPQEEAGSQEQETSEDEQQDGSKASRQAAKYRRQLRETEAERDTLQQQVSTLRRTIAEEALSGVLAKPSSLWLTGVNPAEFYDESGNLDTEALTRAAKESAAENGLQPHRRFGGSADGGVRQSSPAPRRFSDMFRADKATV